jgi:hypothetical protein
MEVLHLDFRPATSAWALPLQSKLQSSSSLVLQERYRSWSEVGLAERGFAVTTRLSIAFCVARRIQILVKQLRDEVAASRKLEALLSRGAVYSPNDPWLVYEICAAVDAFFFEYRSCYELLGHFFKDFGEHMLGKTITEKELTNALADPGFPTEWIKPLQANRILFFHNTAPWIALRINDRDPLNCSLVVMKKNLHSFDEPEDYVLQSDLAETIEGFQKASWRLRDWLLEKVEDFEKSERDAS